MSVERVRGKNVAVFIFRDGLWKLYACGRSCTLNRVTEFIKTSVSGSGLFATYKPTENSFTGEITGVTHINKSGMINLADLEIMWIAQTIFLMRFQRTSDLGVVYTSEASFFITNLPDSGDYKDIATFSMSVQGTGAITQVAVATPSLNTNPIMRIDYSGIADETNFTNASLIGKSIIEVVKDGVGYAPIITSGTPVAKEVKYTTATGNFEFAMGIANGEKVYVLYQNI